MSFCLMRCGPRKPRCLIVVGVLADRTWGEFNAAAIRHPLSSSLPIFSGWLDMPADHIERRLEHASCATLDLGARPSASR